MNTPFIIGQKVQWLDARGLLRTPIWEGMIIEITPKQVRVRWNNFAQLIGRFTPKAAQKELEIIS